MSYQLTLEPIGECLEVEERQSVLDACLRAGFYLPHACCHGLCATCKVQVLDGEVDHGEASSFALMDFERDEGKILACCATLQSDLVIEADIEEEPDARSIPVRDFQARVSRIETLTPTIKGFWFELEAGAKLDFQAGQYVNLHLPDGSASRAFSLANRPGQAELELNIRRVPGGQVTTYLHDQLQVGDRLTLSGPYGRFFVRESAGLPTLFIAGGSGLSSPRAMILDLLARGSRLPITLIYGARSRAELYYHEEFLALVEEYSAFTYLPVLSDEPAESGWNGAWGLAHDAARAHFEGDFRGHKAYLCGPPAMIEACIATLMQGRLFEEDIYTEKFFSAADAQQVRSPLFRRL